ncbi:MAG: 2-hydroxyacyl-CoA dehydratase [Deltaproteobacteria bacterium]|nr:2-hydroxyacyl-CoA dehydratase [Deltaproteobacteria bacterium]
MDIKLDLLRQNRHDMARLWKKETGGKVVGVFCCNVPEELIYAAGMLPVRLMGEKEEASEADLHFPSNCCPYVKRSFDQGLKHRYDYLDGIIVPNTCDMVRAMYGTWKMNLDIPFAYFLEVPQRISPRGIEFFRERILDFKGGLEEWSGCEITAKAIEDAIETYNLNRRLLQSAGRFRQDGLLSGVECQNMVISSMFMPKDEHNRLMGAFLEEAARRDTPPLGVRLLISASMLDNSDFIRLLEECGGSVVADDMPAGSRYFFYSVNHSSDPFFALAERYLVQVPCPRKMLPRDRFEFIKQVMEETGAEGAVIHNLKACDCHLYEYPYLKKMLQDLGLPVLFFRGEETEAEQETQRDDIEAFIEMIRG